MAEIYQDMDVLALYRQEHAYLEGHFLLASGKHSPYFLQSTRVMQYPKHTDLIAEALAKRLHHIDKLDFVIGPAMGGVTLAYALARALNLRALFAEKTSDKSKMLVREAFPIEKGQRFIAVEDVLTTGGSVKKAIQAAEALGASCAAVACVIDRGLSDLKPISLKTLTFPTYEPSACPLCQQGLPLEEV
ncbi:MAG: orotate phosphoribosyltransferase [Deinococcales bacterium]